MMLAYNAVVGEAASVTVGTAGGQPMEYDRVQESYVRHFTAVAERLGPQLCGAGKPDQGRLQLRAVATLGLERENLMAAFDAALAGDDGPALMHVFTCLAEYLDVTSEFPLLSSCARCVLAWGKDNAHPRLTFEAALAMGRLRWRYGHYASARSYAAAALALVQRLEDPSLAARCWQLQAALDYNQGRYQSSRTLYEQALTTYRHGFDRHGEANVLNLLGLLESNEGQAQRAHELFSEALELARASGDCRTEAHALNNLGSLVRETGELDESQELHSAALTIRHSLGDRHGEAGCLNNLGIVAMRRGDSELAREMYRQSLALKRELGDRQGQFKTLGNLGNLEARLGNLPAAEDFLQQALTLSRKLGDIEGEGIACGALADVYLRLGSLGAAARQAAHSLALKRHLGSPHDLAEAAVRGAAVLAAAGRLREAALALHGGQHWAAMSGRSLAEDELVIQTRARLADAAASGMLPAAEQSQLVQAARALDISELANTVEGLLQGVSAAT